MKVQSSGFLYVFLFLLSLIHPLSHQQARAHQTLAPHSPFLFLSARDHLTPESLINSSFVKKNSSLYQSLLNMDLAYNITNKIIEEVREKINIQFIKPGTLLTVFRKWDGSFHRILIPIDSLNFLEITKNQNGQWSNDLKEVETQKEVFHYMGLVENNFWNSATEQKIPPQVIIQFAEIFGWQIDFSREVQKGDFWSFSIEKLFINGHFAGWGEIVCGKYQNRKKTYKAYLYKTKKIHGYFDENGQSLIRVFLKSPIKFGRITSHFSYRRYHPIHHRYQPHKGVDYGAPWGTPIRSVGDGIITKIGRYGGSGNMIVIKHFSGYQTKYLHMSRFKAGLRRNSKVLQGETIGYVGATGLATGPHLHFEMLKHGRNLNPIKVKNFPSTKSIPPSEQVEFQKHIHSVNRNNIASKSIYEKFKKKN